MADYALGDIQGCYEPLQRLLDHIDFNEREDRLWFAGDLVNRGPQSLEVLRFINKLPISPVITLGNHDLHLLSCFFGQRALKGNEDTLHAIFNADDGEELGHWLRQQHLIYYCPKLDFVMSHAGIPPIWDLSEALLFGHELEKVLGGEEYGDFLTQMYGNTPSLWSDSLVGIPRFRAIANYLTRMRFCTEQGQLELESNESARHALPPVYPWYEVPGRKEIKPDILFGHWAALKGLCPSPRIHALDTGCIWGGQLTALRLQDKQRFSVPGVKV